MGRKEKSVASASFQDLFDELERLEAQQDKSLNDKSGCPASEIQASSEEPSYGFQSGTLLRVNSDVPTVRAACLQVDGTYDTGRFEVYELAAGRIASVVAMNQSSRTASCKIHGLGEVSIPLSVLSAEAVFSGSWRNRAEIHNINGTTLHWDGGGKIPIRIEDSSVVSICVHGMYYTATLDDEGSTLMWSDGDLWTRVEECIEIVKEDCAPVDHTLANAVEENLRAEERPPNRESRTPASRGFSRLLLDTAADRASRVAAAAKLECERLRAKTEQERFQEEHIRQVEAKAAAIAAEERRKSQQHRCDPSCSAVVGPFADFPVGIVVEALEAMIIRVGEATCTKEVGKITQGRQCRIVGHGTVGVDKEPSRRLRILPLDGQSMNEPGWVSCRTKGGKQLLKPVAVPSRRSRLISLQDGAAEACSALVCVSNSPSHHDARSDMTPEEANAEAKAVRAAFGGLGVVDENSSEDEVSKSTGGRGFSVPGVTWQERVEEVPDDIASVTEARRLRLMEGQRQRKEGRNRRLNDGIRKALSERRSDLQMPSIQGISSVSACSGSSIPAAKDCTTR